jgi:sulfur transfer protein SufE
MAFLSIARDGMMVGCANPIYLTSEADYSSGAKITFEVLESDAAVLKRLVGTVETFGFDTTRPPFRAELTSLDPCTSTALALSLMRDRPAMRGVFTVQ